MRCWFFLEFTCLFVSCSQCIDMRIGIVGLGLIGSSVARAVKKHTAHTVAAWDCDPSVLAAALRDGVADLTGEAEACGGDLVFVCLLPETAVEFILKHSFAHIVCDVCGVKCYTAQRLSGRVPGYVGVHPMAGKEDSGYHAGEAELFADASLIIAADDHTNPEHVQRVAEFAKSIGFGNVVVTTPERHDRVIAYTSQLAHVVSSAFVKSDTAPEYVGFSAGSFADLTRVARLEPQMWAQLFMENRENLSREIEQIIRHLSEYHKVIAGGDRDGLLRLLAEGREKKDFLDALRGGDDKSLFK